jgi:hypothetical protein
MLEAENKAKEMSKSNRRDEVKKITKETNKEHKSFKKKEHENIGIIDQLKSLNTSFDATKKFMDELMRDREKY